MVGRTHLQDATPITLGQIISGWVAQLDQAIEGIRRTLPGPLRARDRRNRGRHRDQCAIRTLAPSRRGRSPQETGQPFVSAPNKFAALSAHDAMVDGERRHPDAGRRADENRQRCTLVRFRAAGGTRGAADSGERAGILDHAGKVNPTQCEALTQVVVRVFGNDHAVAFAGSQGNFQLNVFKPVILHGVLESIELIADACRPFEERCARGIEPDLPIASRSISIIR